MSGAAFGAPGSPPTWCSSDKDFVTTALGASRLWATIGHGVINEVYWPSTGEPQIRDLTFYLVNDSRWIDLKRIRRYEFSKAGPFLPAVTIRHAAQDYALVLEILPDPRRDVLLVRFAITGAYRLVVILAPHLSSTGTDNSVWIQDGVGYASRGDHSLCLAANLPLRQLSCGYVGQSDGWQDLNRHGALTYDFTSAVAGTVALSAEAVGQTGIVALGFADCAVGAHTLVKSALAEGFDALKEEFLGAWRRWGSRLKLPRPTEELGDAALICATVLKMHEDRDYPGAVVASLSVPWGNSTDTLGGYHLVWPRDATLTAFALLAANQISDARHLLAHLIATQLPDGHWPQNYFPSGLPFWTGIQLDESAFPVLLAAKLHELGHTQMPGTARMVKAAVAYIANAGPMSDEDRWEENPGVSPFTVAVEIAALICAGPWLTSEERAFATALADDWNERLESWCYVENTDLCNRLGVAGYYVRLAQPHKSGDLTGRVQLKNQNGETILASALVSLDFSYLVRLGLRRATDSRVQDTIKVIDAVLRVATPSGDLYHRYNEDGYGEHADGSPFDGRGIGRAWPLLVGERGHLALQSGEDPIAYLKTIWNCSSVGGLLPEQVWDAAPIPALGLEPGRPSGSAMPLLWSHAEFLKLLAARETGRPIELLQAMQQRYGTAEACIANVWHWRTEVPVFNLPNGRTLCILDRRPFSLHMGFDGWQELSDREAVAQPFSLWGVRIGAEAMRTHRVLNFTRRYRAGWEGIDHEVQLAEPQSRNTLRKAG